MQDCGYVDIVFLTIPLDQRMSAFTYIAIADSVRALKRLAGRPSWIWT